MWRSRTARANARVSSRSSVRRAWRAEGRRCSTWLPRLELGGRGARRRLAQRVARWNPTSPRGAARLGRRRGAGSGRARSASPRAPRARAPAHRLGVRHATAARRSASGPTCAPKSAAARAAAALPEGTQQRSTRAEDGDQLRESTQDVEAIELEHRQPNEGSEDDAHPHVRRHRGVRRAGARVAVRVGARQWARISATVASRSSMCDGGFGHSPSKSGEVATSIWKSHS